MRAQKQHSKIGGEQLGQKDAKVIKIPISVRIQTRQYRQDVAELHSIATSLPSPSSSPGKTMFVFSTIDYST